MKGGTLEVMQDVVRSLSIRFFSLKSAKLVPSDCLQSVLSVAAVFLSYFGPQGLSPAGGLKSEAPQPQRLGDRRAAPALCGTRPRHAQQCCQYELCIGLTKLRVMNRRKDDR